MSTTEIIHVEDIAKSYKNPEGNDFLVLDGLNFKLFAGEIVALVGKSGSGKSTLTRIIAGLERPSQGHVYYQKKPVIKPIPSAAMVFQSFALMPWLSVLENVELGLEAKGVSKSERRKRALKAIDVIGLDGFESAYPKELSGGMRQRVGFARALVVEPELLLMDEPFSALDVLTAENLRNDLLDLWQHKKMQTQCILLVTHDIEEAILMADRIFVFKSDPGSIQAELMVNLPYPREPQSNKFRYMVDRIYTLMTISERERLILAKRARTKAEKAFPDYAYRLPEVNISELTGLLESMESHEKEERVDLPDLAEDLHLDINSIFPLIEVLDMLRFIKISKGDLLFTQAGRAFASADILVRKQLFAQHLLGHIPLAQHIRTHLDADPNHAISEDIFLDALNNYFSEEEAERILRVIIDWGRYAEIFAYDYDTGMLSLENPQ